jgi:tetratricopeptide (TPR) repeat protein
MKLRWAMSLTAVTVVLSMALGISRLRGPSANRLVQQAASFYRRSDWEHAAESARLALRSRPSETSALRILARSSARMGNDEIAEVIYRRLGTASMEAEDLFLLGRGLLKRDVRGPGLASLGAARDLDPNHPETLDALIDYLIDVQALTQAAEDAERLRHQPGWEVRGLVVLARVRHMLLEPAAAADLFFEALHRDPQLTQGRTDTRQARKLLARCLLEVGRPDQARQQLETVLEMGPDSEALWLVSRALLMEGKMDQARAAFDQSVKIETADPLRDQPAPYVGAASCARCHLREFQSRERSRHAQSIQTGSALRALPWPEGPVADLNHPGVTHSAARSDDMVEVNVQVDNAVFSAVVEYAMGSCHQGRSFVGHDRQGQARELRLSQYPSAPLWSRTSEHPETPPGPDGYLGRPLAEDSVRQCVHCHSTNFRAIQDPQGRAEADDHGIGCERCHGPAGHHVRAVEAKFPDLAVARPKIAQPAQVVALCGQCHKAPETASPDKPNFIRFQAPTLVQSRCYTESGKLSCVTCHNPHRDASRDPASYEAICVTCHNSPRTQDQSAEKAIKRDRTWTPCSTGAERGCLGCHMPRIPDAVPRATFTDHHIRIRHEMKR